MIAQRMLALWCPDWPVRALGTWVEPVAIIEKGEVFACNQAARDRGVTRRLRRREAQARCPSLLIYGRDEDSEARKFESVVSALERISPLVEVVRPGLCITATRGPSRYFGGDNELLSCIKQEMQKANAGSHSIGVAEGRFAAEIAARSGMIVPPGQTPLFLSPLSVELLNLPNVTQLLKRLGIRTLGQLAELPAEKVLDRFGPDGRDSRLLALGEELETFKFRGDVEDLVCRQQFEDPVQSAESMGFVARESAAKFLDSLNKRGLACRCLAVEMHTTSGEVSRRVWRHDIAFDETSVVDRVRWQLDGWLTHNTSSGPVECLVLDPNEVLPANGRQFELWGGESDDSRRVARAVARVQASLGFDAVSVPRLRGARNHQERIGVASWDERNDSSGDDKPWPGGMPAFAPSIVHSRPLSVSLHDSFGKPVMVGSRGLWNAIPEVLQIPGEATKKIVSHSSPWLFDERWWSQDAKRRVNVQLVTEEGSAYLLTFENAHWWLVATYS